MSVDTSGREEEEGAAAGREEEEEEGAAAAADEEAREVADVNDEGGMAEVAEGL